MARTPSYGGWVVTGACTCAQALSTARSGLNSWAPSSTSTPRRPPTSTALSSRIRLPGCELEGMRRANPESALLTPCAFETQKRHSSPCASAAPVQLSMESGLRGVSCAELTAAASLLGLSHCCGRPSSNLLHAVCRPRQPPRRRGRWSRLFSTATTTRISRSASRSTSSTSSRYEMTGRSWECWLGSKCDAEPQQPHFTEVSAVSVHTHRSSQHMNQAPEKSLT